MPYDCFWGNGGGIAGGLNKLGELLMQLRAEFQDAAKQEASSV
jgi:predicted NAD-dependent protein-ADP-ribosyltransferase YbiA (DUF1768 family)